MIVYNNQDNNNKEYKYKISTLLENKAEFGIYMSRNGCDRDVLVIDGVAFYIGNGSPPSKIRKQDCKYNSSQYKFAGNAEIKLKS